MKRAGHGWRAGRGDARGSTALEFALVAPPFLLLLCGILYVSLMTYTTSALNYAVQEGARCASVRTTTCPDAATTRAYARSRYFGPGTPSFTTLLNSGCGNSVSGSITQSWNFGFFRASVPVSASACFPVL